MKRSQQKSVSRTQFINLLQEHECDARYYADDMVCKLINRIPISEVVKKFNRGATEKGEWDFDRFIKSCPRELKQEVADAIVYSFGMVISRFIDD